MLRLLSFVNVLQVVGLTLLAITILLNPKPHEEPWQQYLSSASCILLSICIAVAARFTVSHFILEIGVFFPSKQIPLNKNIVMQSLSPTPDNQVVYNPMLRVVTGGIFKNNEFYFPTSQVTTKNIHMLFPSEYRQTNTEKVTDYFFFRLKNKKYFYLMDITTENAFLDRQRMYELFGSKSKELRSF